MPRNTDGSVTVTRSFALDDNEKIQFKGEHLDEAFSELNTVFDNSLNIKGSNKMQNNLKMNSYKIKKVKKSNNATSLVRVGDLAKGIFAEDKERRSDNINLVQKTDGVKVTAYKDGMIIYFKGIKKTYDSFVTQVQLNGLGYKDIINVAYGTIGADDYKAQPIKCITYLAKEDKFMFLDGENKPLEVVTAKDLNDYIFNTRIVVKITSDTKNLPSVTVAGGYLTVIRESDTKAVIQIFKATSGKIYYRIFNNGVFGKWLNIVQNDLGIQPTSWENFKYLAMEGSNNGAFKINKSNGADIPKDLSNASFFKSKANQDITMHMGGYDSKSKYYSVIVFDDFSKYTLGSGLAGKFTTSRRPSGNLWHYVYAITGRYSVDPVRYLGWIEDGSRVWIVNYSDNRGWVDCIHTDQNNNNSTYGTSPFKDSEYHGPNRYYLYWSK